MQTRLTKFLPLIIFASLAIVMWQGLKTDTRVIQSVLIGKPVPEFKLAGIEGAPAPGFAAQDLRQGRVSVVNIFASWCIPCRMEHPILLELAKRSDIANYGINNKDATADALKFITDLGSPYLAIGADNDGRVSIDWGGYGVPETFVIDGTGLIRYKQIGPLTPDTLPQFLAEIEKAKQPAKP